MNNSIFSSGWLLIWTLDERNTDGRSWVLGCSDSKSESGGFSDLPPRRSISDFNKAFSFFSASYAISSSS
ncbi:MAG TPA: hypothetical protein PK467_08470 [Candidatus Wallbacteria bacterium]|nr:hypothetical protein [Candidatus Wallbacteria bacterium]